MSVDQYTEQFIATFYIYVSPSTYDFCKLDLHIYYCYCDAWVSSPYFKIKFLLHGKHTVSFTELKWLMLFKEILATLSENYAKHKNGFILWVACSVFKLMYITYIDTTVFKKGYRAIQYV
jgi:hypothetical protein